MSDPRRRNGHELLDPVRRQRRMQHLWARQGERSLGENLAMIGVLGWLVVVPTLGGLFIGRWLDRSLASGVFWSASLLFAGAALGLWLIWRHLNE